MSKKIDIFGLQFVMMIALAFVISRAFFLTIIMGPHFRSLAANNMIRRGNILPTRGLITDANGKYLAMNIDNNGKTVRFYPDGEVVASIVGYMGRTDEKVDNCSFWCDGDTLLGKSGLEKEYQDVLFGVPGETVVEETANHKIKNTKVTVEPISGKNLKTNIDMEVQKTAFLALRSALQNSGKSGSVIVSKVSGEVIALVSYPSFDPNLFIPGGKRSDFGGEYKDVSSLLQDTEKKPLFNRALTGNFAPGSVYKLVPALAALEEGKIAKETMIADTGEIKIGEYRFGNWFLDKYGKTEGELNVVRALARSNDVFFYHLGEALGADSLISWTNKVGLGESTGIDLPGEALGFVPTPYWREKTLGEKWFLGNTYHMSIGQGDLMATPLQINRLTSAVISGLKCPLQVAGSPVCEDLNITKKNRDTVIEGMEEACSPGGTAFPLFEYGGKIYCKTGTAQKGGKDTLPNAWISVVIPKGDERKNWLIVTVLVEEGGEGSAVAAPVAKEILPLLIK